MTADVDRTRIAAGKKAMRHPPQLSDYRILRRLARDYLGARKAMLSLAVVCMVVAAGMNGLMAWLLGPVVQKIFIERDVRMVIVLPLVVVVIVTVRAVATFLQETTLTSIAERVVSDVQRDMFASQIRLDIAAFSDMHSGELVSKFLYDATLLRGSITRSIPTLGTQLLTLVAMATVMLYRDWQLALEHGGNE
jgi:subfamily B ATP-binding cassette protein MsbA